VNRTRARGRTASSNASTSPEKTEGHRDTLLKFSGARRAAISGTANRGRHKPGGVPSAEADSSPSWIMVGVTYSRSRCCLAAELPGGPTYLSSTIRSRRGCTIGANWTLGRRPPFSPLRAATSAPIAGDGRSGAGRFRHGPVRFTNGTQP